MHSLLAGTEIIELNLSHNNLHNIPNEIKKLVVLTCLDISQNPINCLNSNDISGIPLEMSFLQHLRVLKISQCNLRYIPPAIWKCRRLHTLDISRNKINVLPPDIGSLTKLHQLNVQYTSITTLPAEIAYCQELEEILMWGNNVESLPDVLRYLPKLRTIAINFRSFTSVIDNYMEGLLRKGQIKSEHLPAVIFEISGVDHLDLEGTKINQLPAKCAGTLQHLILANNFFQEIPKLILTLDQLTFLDVSGNMIKSLPTEIDVLTNLRKLWLNINEIESLPDSIGSLVSLEELSLSQNLLATFPETLGKLKALHTLIADHNRITSLPSSIGDLQELVTLDLTANLLQALPETMLKMKKLNSAHNYHKFRKHGLWLHKNPLSTPPQAIWKTNDPAKIYNYLKTSQVEKLKYSQRQKLIILGSKQSGKTSLVRTIMAGKSSFTTKPTERTKLVEFSSWTTKNDVKVLIHDTGGDDVFRTVLCPYFLDETAFYLIIFNAADYSMDLYYKLVGCWIDMLLLHCPQAVVKVVGTHLDLCSDSASQEAANSLWKSIRGQLKEHQRKQKAEIAKIDEDIQEEDRADSMDVRRKLQTQRIRLSQAIEKPLQLQRQIATVSSADDLQGMQELLSELEMAFLDSTLFPRVRQLANDKWQTFNQVLKTRPGYYLKWKNVIKLARESDICEKELPDCLAHLQNTGKILWHRQVTETDGLVIHRPGKFVEILQAIFRSDLPNYLDSSRNKVFMGLGQFTDETFAKAKHDLLTYGQLSWPLLKCLCLCFPQNKEKIDITKLASILQQCNLCYIIPQPDVPHNTREVTPFIVIPSYCLKKSESEASHVEWLEQQPEKELELRTAYTFPTATPIMLFSKLSCRIHPLVELRYDWSDLILGKVGNMIIRLTKDANENIDIIVHGSEMYDVQAMLDRMEETMESVIAFYPGLTYRMQRTVLDNQPQDKR